MIEVSKEVPVLVDFWAPWCGPCKQLGPLLEKLTLAGKGAFRLVKMNIDEHPEVAGQLGVQSIPAVFAFKDGRPFDGFMGALPESQLKSFIERVVPEGSDGGISDVLAAGEEALEAGDLDTATEIFTAILGEDPEHVESLAALARCQIETGALSEAQNTLSKVPDDKKSATPVSNAMARLELALKSEESGDRAPLEAKLSANPNDHQSRFDLAIILNEAGDREAALEHILTIISENRDWNEGAAREQLLQFFDAWGNEDACTLQGRRRLSSLLFS